MNLRILLAAIAGFIVGAMWGGFVAAASGATYGMVPFGVCVCMGCIVGSVVCGMIAENWK